jgi:hypothetical protein
MKRLVIAAFAAVVGLGMMVPDAEAKRLGGGKSFGMQRQATPTPAAPAAGRQAGSRSAPPPRPRPRQARGHEPLPRAFGRPRRRPRHRRAAVALRPGRGHGQHAADPGAGDGRLLRRALADEQALTPAGMQYAGAGARQCRARELQPCGESSKVRRDALPVPVLQRSVPWRATSRPISMSKASCARPS